MSMPLGFAFGEESRLFRAMSQKTSSDLRRVGQGPGETAPRTRDQRHSELASSEFEGYLGQKLWFRSPGKHERHCQRERGEGL